MLLQVLPALAQTTVSGAIAVDTRWTAADAPYMLSGDVVVQNGAELTIDPGVTVYMAADAGLTVEAGAIKAVGTLAQPVRVLSDKARLGQAAAPGDWKQWTFTQGTVNTRFEHVSFMHGSGLVVKGSTPVFNFTDIRDHQGAAMTVDLAASPSGAGNQASGNTLNGIAVPAGDITGTIKWALRGIPYVVTTGVVSVGASPAVNSVAPNLVQVGQTATVVLAGTRLAGLASARVDKAGVSAQVLAGGSATQASILVVADASATIGPATLRLLTDAGEIHIDQAITLVQAQATLSGLAPSAVYVGQGSVEVLINGRDFVAASTVMAGETPLATTFVSGTQLRASLPAQVATTNLVIKVRSPDPANAGQYLNSNELILAVRNAQPAVSPAAATVTKGALRTFTVILPFAAPAGGTTLTLVSSVPGVASVPASVLVPEGQNTASFQLTAAGLGDTTVTISRVGMTSVQAQVTVIPPPTLTLTPPTLVMGVERSAELTVASSVLAPAGGMSVALVSSDPAKVTVPATVTIAAGASSASVTVTTVAVGTATVRADFPEFIGASTAVSVRPVSLNMPVGVLVAPNLSRSIPITLSDAAPEGGLVVTLASSNPAVASVPVSVTVPAGASAVNFTLTGVAVGSTSISASAANYQAAVLPVTVDAVQVRFGSSMTSISLPEETTREIAITLSRPAPAGGVVVDLVSGDPAKASVSPAQVTIPEGQTSGGSVVLKVDGLLKGSTTVTASAPGLASAQIPLVVTGKATFVFSRSTVYVAKGFTTYSSELSISRRTDGASYSPDEPVTLTLTSSDPSRAVARNGSVTIPAGSSSVTVFINGVNLTGTDIVTIDATAPKYAAPATKLTTRVIAPKFLFNSMSTSRTPENARDDFSISATTDGAAYPGEQTATVDMRIDLAVTESNPEGIVNAIYSTATGATQVNSVVLVGGKDATAAVWLGTPTTAGSYKVQASVPGVATSTSGLVTVVSPQLKFSQTTVNVPKGFRTNQSELNVQRVVNNGSFNGAESLTVALTSSDPSRLVVPATVTIPANGSSVNFTVTGVDFTGAAPVIVDASAEGYAAPASKLAASVVVPTIYFSGLDTTRATGSERDNFYISASALGLDAAPVASADIAVDYLIVNAAPAGLIDGFSSAATGGTPLTRATLRMGTSSTLPTYAYANTPTAAGSYRIRAVLQNIGAFDSSAVTVTPPDLKFGTRTSYTSGPIASTAVAKGFHSSIDEIRVFRSAGGSSINANAPVTVTLTSSDPNKVSVPATVTIPAGSASVHFLLTGIDLTGSAPVTLSATAEGHNSAVNAVQVGVPAPKFDLTNLSTHRSPESERDSFGISVGSVTDARYGSSQKAVADIPIDLAIVEQSPAGIVGGFYSAATGDTPITRVTMPRNSGDTSTSYVAPPTMAGTYKVEANAAGLGSVRSAVVTVLTPRLTFSRTTATVGKGLDSYFDAIHITRTVNGGVFNGSAPVTVSLGCTSTIICSVPASVTIPAGQSSIAFKVSGKEIGSTTVTATAEGYESVQDLAVKVVSPALKLSLPANIKVGAQGNVTASFDAEGTTNQSPTSAITVNLTSSSPGVATIPATLTIAQNQYTSTAKLTGVAPGTTTVTASGPGLESVTSGVISITP